MSEEINTLKKSFARKSTTDFDYGKLPPQAKDFEQAVLAAIMIESKAIFEVIDILTPDCFYVESHQFIYRAIVDIHNENSPIDLLTVTERLKSVGRLEAAGGPFAIAQMTNFVGSAANIEYHARIILERYMARQLITASSKILSLAYEDETDIFELMSTAQNTMDEINNSVPNGETFKDSVHNTIQKLSEAQENFTKTGLMSYLPKFDNHTGGLQAGELIIIAGRPGMGKSSVMCDWSYWQAKNKIPVGIFTLEMSKESLIHRFISIETEVPYQKMRTGGLSDYEIKALRRMEIEISELPINIHDEGGMGIGKMLSIAKMWRHRFGIKALYVDYLQLATVSDLGRKFGTREQEVSTISGKLKALAKNLGIPVIALSQLGRKVEEREDKRPLLSDLRESGAIEQDADMVIFPFRPSIYKMSDEMGQPFSDVYMDMIIAKFRAGKTEDLNIDFEMPYSRFKREAWPVYETTDNPF